MTKRWLGAVVIVLMLAFTAYAYPSLPDRIPTHWNVFGEVDRWSSRLWGALLAPVVALSLLVLLPVLRRIDPRRRNYERFGPTFNLVINVLILFLAAVHVMVLGAGLGWSVDISRVMLVMLGLMFAALGNHLPRLRSNWWMGIRTPWTLESEEVWRATHRLGGYTFVTAGVLTIVAALLPRQLAFGVATGCMMAGALIPVVYSYVAFRRERRGDSGAT